MGARPVATCFSDWTTFFPPNWMFLTGQYDANLGQSRGDTIDVH
ncbi:hypothetical protein EKH55_5592 (plasmid) [Sinorhizobium alkalisoli]|nr:hypothetical protein EKH55_5592 [Sinorhizobium alkalisoli]